MSHPSSGKAPLRQQRLFPSPSSSASPARQTRLGEPAGRHPSGSGRGGGGGNGKAARAPAAAEAKDAAILQRLWKLYCAPLSQTHHRALTYADPIVGEMWKLFAPLLRNAAVLPLDPASTGAGGGGGDSSAGVGRDGAESNDPRSQLSDSAIQAFGSGTAPPPTSARAAYRSVFEGSDDEAELAAEEAVADGGTDMEAMPITHVFCIHLQRSHAVREMDSGGFGIAAEEEESGKGPFPMCTAEMHAALTEQPRIMLPLLEFLAAVMALQRYQAARAGGASMAAPPLPGVFRGDTGLPGAAAPPLFNPLRSRLYGCVAGDTGHPTSFEHLGAAQLGRLIAVRGTLVRMSPPRITCLTMAYRCGLCGAVKRQAAEDGLLVYPGTCTGKCRGYKWAPLTEESECEEVQILKIQEVTDFCVDVTGPTGEAAGGSGGGGGGMTKVMEVELRAPWLDHATVGDMVSITGVLSTRRGDRKAGGTQQICIRARSLVAARQGGGGGREGRSDGSGPSASSSSSVSSLSRNAAVAALLAPMQQQQQQQPLWSPEEAARFYEMSRHPQWFARLANSVAPSLYGLQTEKEAVLLAMIGGSSGGSKLGARSNIHLLLVGDPGMGKSQLLRAACTVAPRSAFVCAHTSSSCGLTMTLSRDPVSGETAFEAGAVVHGDGGITCIDELDKAAAEHKALLEVMEQESVSIAKAGMVFSMPVHTSVLAAGNPVGGRFDFSKPITSNLNLSPALLSRFDIIVCLRDAPQPRPPASTPADGDSVVADRGDAFAASHLTSHVLELHRRRAGERAASQASAAAGGGDPRRKAPANASPTHGNGTGGAAGVLPHTLVQDFIVFSRAQCHPTLSREACDVLKFHYLSERARRAAQGSVHGGMAVGSASSSSAAVELHPVTPRYLQALIRVAEARAKVELRLEVSREDAEYAVHLLQSCLGTFRSPGGAGGGGGALLGPPPAAMTGAARKKRNQQEQVIDLLKAEMAQNGGVNLFSHAAILDICETVGCRNPNGMLHQLNEFGILLSSGGKYKLRGG